MITAATFDRWSVQGGLERGQVVPGHRHDGLRDRARDAAGGEDRARGSTPGVGRIGVGDQGVDHRVVAATVEVAVDLDDDVAPGVGTRQAHRRGHRLAARRHEADGLGGGDLLGQAACDDLAQVGLVADDDAVVEAVTHGGHDGRVGVAEHGAPVGHEHVDVRPTVGRLDRGAVRRADLEVGPGEGVDAERRGDAAKEAPGVRGPRIWLCHRRSPFHWHGFAPAARAAVGPASPDRGWRVVRCVVM